MSLHREPPRVAPAILATAAVAVAIWGEVLLGGATFARGDYREETVPARLWAAERHADGELPAWWDGVGLGVPFAANPRHGALYPAAWPLAAAPRPAAIDIWLLLHLAWLAGGVALLARRLGSDPLAAVISGAAAAAGGVATSALASGDVAALAWTPWALVAADRLVASAPGRSPGALLALAAAAAALAMQILAGGLWLAPATALLAHALAAGQLRPDVDGEVDDGARSPPRTHALLLAAQALALACAAVVFLPALGLGEAGHPHGPLHGGRAIELLWPGISGDPGGAAVPLGNRGPMPASPHIGLALLGLAALAAGERRLRPLAIAAGALVVAAFALSADLLAPAAVSVAALAGVGLGRLVAARFGRAAALAGLIAVVVCAAAVIVAAIRPALLAGLLVDSPGAARRALGSGATAAGVLVLLAALAVIIARSPRRHGWAVPLFGALLVGGAVAHAWQVMPRIDRSLLEARPPLLADLELADGPRARLARPPLAGDRAPPAAAAERALRAVETAVPNLGIDLGLAQLRGRDPARQTVIDRAWAASAAGGERLLDLWDVEYVAVPASVAVPAGLPVVGEDQASGTALVGNPDRRPRAFVARRWRWHRDIEEVMDARFGTGPRAEVALGTVDLIGDGEAAPELAGQTPPLPCELDQPRPERALLRCRSAEGGYAVLLDAGAPGWRATVDGEPAPILVADGLARAVRVDPGDHEIEMEYRTPGLRGGALVSLAGWLGVLAALGWALVMARRGQPGRRIAAPGGD